MLVPVGYTILSCLNDGANSRVYRGLGASKRPVIIKTLGTGQPAHGSVGLRREYEIAKSLAGFGAVEPLELVPFGNSEAIIFEDFGGASLNTLIPQEPPLSELLAIFIRLAEILGDIHSRGVVHKDIKPANIIVNCESGEVKLTDFRIASLLARERQEIAPPEFLEGTPAYMAPEQTGRMNRGLDHRADLYSLGVTMYEAFTGELPFACHDAIELLHAHIARLPDPPSARRSDLPEGLSQVILRLLGKNAEDRYQSGFGLREDLRHCLAELQAKGGIAAFDLGSKDIPTTLRFPERLYGREGEQAELKAAFERSREGAAEFVFLTGSAGIGKTALAMELGREVQLRQGHLAAGKFEQLQKDVPYFAIKQALSNLARQLLAEGSERAASWGRAIRAAVGENGGIITELAPEFELVIGRQERVSELPSSQARNRFQMVFSSFVRVLAKRDHPLVFFIDDLQWADPASLELVKQLASEPGLNHLLFLGAYRPQEVGAEHELNVILTSLKASMRYGSIPLEPIPSHGLAALLADCLYAETSEVSQLVSLIMEKTHGNPFFMRQFLQELYQKEILYFDSQRLGWSWIEAKIRDLGVTDNVVDFLAGRLRAMEKPLQEHLSVAAAIGSRFSLTALATIRGCPQSEIASELFPALVTGVLEPLGVSYKFVSEESQEVRYRFSHDRVQQAAYSLIAEEEREALHLSIGRFLLKSRSESKLEKELFEIVGHLNTGARLIEEPAQRTELANLNLRAARKARAATAFATGRELAAKGIKLFGEKAWDKKGDDSAGSTLIEDLLLLEAECAALSGSTQEADTLLAEVLERTKSLEKKIEAYILKVTIYGILDQREQAVAVGLEGLKLLGLNLPFRPSKAQVGLNFARLYAKVSRLEPEDLLTLPETKDRHIGLVYSLLSSILDSAYFVNQNLFANLLLRFVKLSLRHGIGPGFSFGLVAVPFTLIKEFGAIEAAKPYAEIQLALGEKERQAQIRHRSRFVAGCFFSHWSHPYQRSVGLLEESFRGAVSCGDITYAGYSGVAITLCLLSQGLSISEVLRWLEPALTVAQRGKDKYSIDFQLLDRQFIRAIQGETKGPCSFSDESYDEAVKLESFSSRGSENLSYHHYYFKGILEILQGNFEAAKEAFFRGRPFQEAAALLPSTAEHLFYLALAQGALQKGRSFVAAWRLVRAARTLGKWARNCPENFRHKHLLICAEIARLRGRRQKAARLYEEASTWAHEHGYLHQEGIICERAGRVSQALGQKILAFAYLARARQAFRQWGAKAKVKALEAEFPELTSADSAVLRARRELSDTDSIEGYTTTQDDHRFIDLASVIRASQEISSEVVLEKLLERLIQIVIANVGAQRGVLLLAEGEKLWVRAQGTADSASVGIKEVSLLEGHEDLPRAVIEYAVSSRETTVWTSGGSEALFSKEPYLEAAGVKSLLCLPLLRQKKAIGALYLENRLATDVFTAERVDVLEMLGVQIAISIENAALYSDLEGKVKERTRELEEALKKITIISNTDVLTGISNRRHFLELFGKELDRAQRYGRPLSFFILDIDHFKTVNDTYGHQSGDVVLREIARILCGGIRCPGSSPATDSSPSGLRKTDLVGRLGGEEFAILLTETPLSGAQIVAERLRVSVESSIFRDHTGSQTIPLTVSLGGCSLSEGAKASMDEIYSLADQELYRAKAEGRNRSLCLEYNPGRDGGRS